LFTKTSHIFNSATKEGAKLEWIIICIETENQDVIRIRAALMALPMNFFLFLISNPLQLFIRLFIFN